MVCTKLNFYLKKNIQLKRSKLNLSVLDYFIENIQTISEDA